MLPTSATVGCVTARGYRHVFKIFSVPNSFPLVFNYFEPCIVKIALEKNALDEGLLYTKISVWKVKLLHLECSFVWSWNSDTSAIRSQIPGEFWNAVLEYDGEDHLDRSCGKWNFTKIHRNKNILQTIKRGNVTLIGHMLRKNCLLKHVTEGKIEE